MPIHQPSAEPAHIPLLSAFLTHQVKPPLQPSYINPPPLPQLSALPHELDAHPLQPSDVCAAPPPQFSILLQGRVKPPILYSTVRAYVPLISALVLIQGMPLCQPSAEHAPLPRL